MDFPPDSSDNRYSAEPPSSSSVTPRPSGECFCWNANMARASPVPEPASVRIGSAETALTRIRRSEVDREVALRGFQGRLGDAHHVVVRRHPHRTAGVRHQVRRAPGKLGEGEAGDQHRAGEILARGVGIAPLELVLVGERDGVHHAIEPTGAAGVPALREDRGWGDDVKPDGACEGNGSPAAQPGTTQGSTSCA